MMSEEGGKTCKLYDDSALLRLPETLLSREQCSGDHGRSISGRPWKITAERAGKSGTRQGTNPPSTRNHFEGQRHEVNRAGSDCWGVELVRKLFKVYGKQEGLPLR